MPLVQRGSSLIEGANIEPQSIFNRINLNSYQKNSVFGPVRAVPGYNKLLFPYHEFNIIADYTASIDGQNYKVVVRYFMYSNMSRV